MKPANENNHPRTQGEKKEKEKKRILMKNAMKLRYL